MLVGGHTFLALGNPPKFIFPKGCNFFPADCSFKVSERPSKLLRRCPHSHCRVCVVNDYFVSCPHSQLLCRQCSLLPLFRHSRPAVLREVGEVVYSRRRIRRISQQLRGHATFKQYQIKFFVTFIIIFFLQK